MDHRIGDIVRLRRDSRLVEPPGRVGTDLGVVGDAWADEDGEHIGVVHEDEQVQALGVAPVESAAFRRRRAVPRRSAARRTSRASHAAIEQGGNGMEARPW